MHDAPIPLLKRYDRLWSGAEEHIPRPMGPLLTQVLP